MKKRLLICGGVVLAVILVVVGVLFWQKETKDLPKYFIVHGILEYDGRSYTQQTNNLFAIDLGSQIGITDLEQQVFEIKGQSPTDWVCVRIDGAERIYRFTGSQHLDIGRFEADKIIAKPHDDLVAAPKTVISKDVIASLIGDLKDDNLVPFPETLTEMKQLNLVSSTHPGLSYVLAYIHDSENGHCFIYDSSSESTWMTGHALMEALE